MKNLNVSQYLHFISVDKDIYAGWNRYYPSIFIMNQAVLDLLDRIREGNPPESNDTVRAVVEEFKRYRFVYEGDRDPAPEHFRDMTRQALEESDRQAESFYHEKKDYGVLRIVNDVCNLNCAYCVNEDGAAKKHTPPRAKISPERRWEVVSDCLDHFLARKQARGVSEARITFNGGEILVDWPLIQKIPGYIREKYPDIKVTYDMNTNLTLLTEEIAGFLTENDFTLHISIDGYRAAHDQTRVYHSGKGSFDDIMEKVRLFRKYSQKAKPDSFQGTINDPDQFDPEEVYRMESHGFKHARLAPNLLGGGTEAQAREKAKMMQTFLELNRDRDFQVTELIFTKITDKINQRDYRFEFNCRGLSGRHSLDIEVNLTSLSVSQLCGFIKKAAVPLAELDYDIYNPRLWEVSRQFIRERMETMLTHCDGCSLLGICSGGCILSAIDADNRMNPPACAYQREMWEIYVKKAYHDRQAARQQSTTTG